MIRQPTFPIPHGTESGPFPHGDTDLPRFRAGQFDPPPITIVALGGPATASPKGNPSCHPKSSPSSAVGAALAGIALNGQRIARADTNALRTELHKQISELHKQISELRDQIGSLRERMAKLEGLLEGLREAITGRRDAA